MRTKIINGVAINGSAACITKTTLVTHHLPQSCQVYLFLGRHSKRTFDSGVTRLGGRRGGFGPRGTGLGEGESGGGIRFGFTGCGRDGAGVPGLTGFGMICGLRSGIFSGMSSSSSVFGSLSVKRFAPDRFASHLIAHPLTFMPAVL
jgi:hypothetical protein